MNAIHALLPRPFQYICSFAALLIGLQGEWRAAAAPAEIPAPPTFKMPPPKRGVTDLKFSEFFVNPIGPIGLEHTAKLQRLRGERVRILGYMVHQENQSPGTFLLTALPVQLHDEHYGLGDDLPAATVLVVDPANQGKTIRHVPGLVLVSGRLELGRREEADGRISLVRLILETSPDSQKRRSAGKGATDLLRRSRL